MPVGLILLVGPPASGKSSFARAWVEHGQLDAAGVVSCDAIRGELFGARVDVGDDPAVFSEMDRRVAARLAADLAVVVDATNVTPSARTRMIAWARQHGRPVAALRFRVADEVLVRRNSRRSGHARVPVDEGLRSATTAARDATRGQLLTDGVDLVVDVPGESDGHTPASAAATVLLGM
ncbi:ATP-binding protein [Actinoplanes sp. NPDC051411]|uniref:ATP-binding protein n=1 Tax=Actinoplanes sp. NPDC051411 TaxID=3155522 RepID=UPI003421FDC8